jgi:hypothetical protein
MLPSLHGLLSKKVRYIGPSDHGISSRLQELRFKTGVLERKVRTEAKTQGHAKEASHSAMVRGEVAMQGNRAEKYGNGWRVRSWGVGCLLVALASNIPQAVAQVNFRVGRSTIAGSVLIDGDTQPAARVRVDVKGVGGGAIATAFTDASGRFEAPAERVL